MKFIKLLLPAILLFAFVCTTEAQIVVTSTTASTEKTPKTKSIRQKGLVVRPEVGTGPGWFFTGSQLSMAISAYCNINYQYNPYLSFGGGIGYNFIHYSGRTINVSSLPLFANIRVNILDKKNSPFFDWKLGFNLPLNTSKLYVPYESNRLIGFNSDFNFGLQVNNFSFGLGLLWYYYQHEEEKLHSDDPNSALALCLKFAYNFQIKKKK